MFGAPSKSAQTKSAHITSAPRGFSVRVFKTPVISSSFAHTAAAKFDVGYCAPSWYGLSGAASGTTTSTNNNNPHPNPHHPNPALLSSGRPLQRQFSSSGATHAHAFLAADFIYERSVSSRSDLTDTETGSGSVTESSTPTSIVTTESSPFSRDVPVVERSIEGEDPETTPTPQHASVPVPTTRFPSLAQAQSALRSFFDYAAPAISRSASQQQQHSQQIPPPLPVPVPAELPRMMPTSSNGPVQLPNGERMYPPPPSESEVGEAQRLAERNAQEFNSAGSAYYQAGFSLTPTTTPRHAPQIYTSAPSTASSSSTLVEPSRPRPRRDSLSGRYEQMNVRQREAYMSAFARGPMEIPSVVRSDDGDSDPPERTRRNSSSGAMHSSVPVLPSERQRERSSSRSPQQAPARPSSTPPLPRIDTSVHVPRMPPPMPPLPVHTAPAPSPAPSMARTRTPMAGPRGLPAEPQRRRSDGDQPLRAPGPAPMPCAQPEMDGSAAVGSRPTRPGATPLDPQRRRSDGFQNVVPLPQQSQQQQGGPRNVRWTDNLVAPSPVLANQRRKGWFNRRGDQLWTNDGAYKPSPPGQEYPPDLRDYPAYGNGWMNEEGVRIDMGHRHMPKAPLRSALKQRIVNIQHE
ncbi:unnamed protein product [Mycena citricolor]|uniref:Uncharacterized protein n=1 Tax=Mycena citricolor TaxID=2018698 RepID=A0AAD2GTY7_9AGAR|nr:unnamed protein product [Mycena citricolor]